MSEEFDLSWLDLREPFDAFARGARLGDAEALGVHDVTSVGS